MKFLSDQKILSKEFKRLSESYSHYKWAVAWAGKEKGFDFAEVLEKNKSKLTTLVVGLHFYQTDPDFIEHYMTNSHVRFIKKTEGIFHSKVYLFYNKEDDWAAIVGSSNFTKQGFHFNDEANILIEGQEATIELFNQISDYVCAKWSEADVFTKEDLVKYRELCSYQKSALKSLSKPIVNKKTRAIDSSKIDVMNWDSYMNGISKADEYTDVRLTLLDKAQELFRKYPHFNDIPLEYRKCLAGFAGTMPDCDTEIDWKLFGSMQGAGKFKNAINTGTAIGKALDLIPLSGDITKKTFEKYCQTFYATSTNPIACATRLLAMKRPDWFICIDSKNKANLCKQFGISQNSLKLNNYWEAVVLRVRESVWFSDGERLTKKEKKIKQYQVAMLDSLYYEY